MEHDLAKAIHRALFKQNQIFLPYVDEHPIDMTRVAVHGEISLLDVARVLIANGWLRTGRGGP